MYSNTWINISEIGVIGWQRVNILIFYSFYIDFTYRIFSWNETWKLKITRIPCAFGLFMKKSDSEHDDSRRITTE